MKPDVKSSTDSRAQGLFRRHGRKLLLLGFVVLVAFLAASPFLTLFCSIAADRLEERWNRLSFDATAWKASLSSPKTSDPIRLRMVDDLLRRHPFIGMSRGDLIALLGTPPKTGYFTDYQFVYWLGPERGYMSIDSEWLAVRFGPDDRVSAAQIVRD